MKRRLAIPLLAGALWSGIARAESPDASPVSVEAVSLLGEGSTALTVGWNGVLVRIHNASSAPVRGQIEVASQQFGREIRDFRATAPFSVAAGAGIFERLPVDVGPYGDMVVTVTSDAGEVLSQSHLSASPRSSVTLLEVGETPRLRAVLNDVAVAPTFLGVGSTSRGFALAVMGARWNTATGDPILPEQSAIYGSIDAVLIRSDALVRLGAGELDALAGYVLAGGTLAVAVARPEDLRHPTLVSLAGGPITRQAVSAAALERFALPAPSAPSSGKTIPPARDPAGDVAELLAGYAGGNLRGSLYGNSAAYGLGEVHLLAFDPTRKPFVDDPWVQARVVDLARRAFDRRSTQVFRPGVEAGSGTPGHVRRQLDPNESSRWAVGAAALLLCIYAVVAGPINFGLAGRAGKPLRALRWLPVIAAAAFACVVAIGVASKGIGGRARHLTLIEAGAGMTKGAVRRWRGFFASRLRELTVRTTDEGSVVGTAIVESSERHDHLVVDREGARLVDVAALPWQTVVVREDGVASLGDGVTLLRDGAADITVVNRSGNPLRAAIVRAPSGSAFYFPRIKDGERVSTIGATALAASADGRSWEKQAAIGVRTGSIELHRLSASLLGPVMTSDGPGLADAWAALEEAAGSRVDWFPEGLPVLIGQLDGGEGRTGDSGLRLESDRLLVRVVGFGGKP